MEDRASYDGFIYKCMNKESQFYNFMMIADVIVYSLPPENCISSAYHNTTDGLWYDCSHATCVPNPVALLECQDPISQKIPVTLDEVVVDAIHGNCSRCEVIF